MVGKGYVAIGDCAFMTTPLVGSGISNSLRAGQILAEEIIKNNSVSIETLWQYQVRYYKEIGAENFFVDCLKRTLLNSKKLQIHNYYSFSFN
jgi:flavin-dependent dehydrogenase